MDECVTFEPSMIDNRVDLELGPGKGFDEAMAAAWAEARARKKDPMLLSWFDRDASRWSPPVECCGKDRPAWLLYAQSRGADLGVCFDGGRFVFLFWGAPLAGFFQPASRRE